MWVYSFSYVGFRLARLVAQSAQCLGQGYCLRSNVRENIKGDTNVRPLVHILFRDTTTTKLLSPRGCVGVKLGTPKRHEALFNRLDGFIAILQNEPNIREVIAFPKTGDGRDLMMSAPSTIDEKQLKELKLEIKKDK